MKLNRRRFLEAVGLTAAGLSSSSPAAASPASTPNGDRVGMLMDTTECIGCRKCESACSQVNHLSDKTLKDFEDFSVYEKQRRMEADSFTVVNRYPNTENPEKPISVKIQCMHCLKPACTSACLVGALRMAENGAVVYDAWKCLGCRYCMVACPFQVPTYEYEDPLTPKVRKCDFCYQRITEEGKLPACAEMCPPMALTFGKRSELLALAHQKIDSHTGRYVNHVYGESEVGGASWLYLAPKEFEKLGFLKLGSGPMPALTEPIQHAIFKFGIPPLMLYGLLGAVMWAYRNGDDVENATAPTRETDHA